MTWVKWNLVSVRFDIVLTSIQDRCTVCTERTIGFEICWDARDGTPWCRGQVEVISVCLEIVLTSMQDRCVVCVKCIIGSKIILDAPDGTLT